MQDPQCNATQYMFKDKDLAYLYEKTSSFYDLQRNTAPRAGAWIL